VIADSDESRALQAAGMASFPGWVFGDGAGQVPARSTGELTIEQPEARIAALRGAAG
jgi:hypothetical protein